MLVEVIWLINGISSRTQSNDNSSEPESSEDELSQPSTIDKNVSGTLGSTATNSHGNGVESTATNDCDRNEVVHNELACSTSSKLPEKPRSHAGHKVTAQ